jgi:pSer/pThr/pTyr-binding forkhead associated (FHA) protein
MEAALNGPTGRIILGPTPLTIGRMPGSQLLITDPQASGYHAEIRQEGQGYSIIDLGSTNGTFVNEQLLVPHVSRILLPTFPVDQQRKKAAGVSGSHWVSSLSCS